MALKNSDFTGQQTTTTGTGPFALSGPLTNRQSFEDGVTVGNTCYVAIVDDVNKEWMTADATLVAPTVVQIDGVLESSNGGAAVNFQAGIKRVYVVNPALKVQMLMDDISSLTAALVITNAAVDDNSDSITDLLVDKEDVFTKNTGFNKNFGLASGDVAEGDHTHESQIEVLDLNPLLVAEGSGMTNHNNVDGETSWATVLYKDTSGRVSLHAMIRNTSGVSIPAGGNIPLCNIPVSWRPRLNQSFCVGANNDTQAVRRLRFYMHSTGLFKISSTFGNTIPANDWYHVQMNWVV
jgi:hypothetical protein